MDDKVRINSTIEISQMKSTWRSSLYFFLYRTTEIFISCLLLILFSPVLLVICLVLLFENDGSIFFFQERVGKNGKPFTIWKFRTMTKNTPPVTLDSSNWHYGVPDDFIYKSGPGSTVTTSGKWLRKTSLDELPQLINVLKGDMSFIGPRPETLNIAKFYNNYQKQRLLVKPGITGYAQVNGRANLSHGYKIYYDLYYVKHHSLKLDIKIIWQTCIQVIKTNGAY